MVVALSQPHPGHTTLSSGPEGRSPQCLPGRRSQAGEPRQRPAHALNLKVNASPRFRLPVPHL